MSGGRGASPRGHVDRRKEGNQGTIDCMLNVAFFNNNNKIENFNVDRILKNTEVPNSVVHEKNNLAMFKIPSRQHVVGVNRPPIVREIPHFSLFPAFPHFFRMSRISGFISK